MKNILLIGCGHMGNALLEAWLLDQSYSLAVVDPKKYKNLKKTYNKKNLKTYKSLLDIKNFTKFNYLVLAIKPSDLKNVLNLIETKIFNKNIILISVIAGKKISTFNKSLIQINKFVRVMPNMPALIGEGINCMTANKLVKSLDKKNLNKLFEKSGKVVWFGNENQIDMATAVSGSGPGFVFNIINAMEKAACELGFSKKTSKFLVNHTFKGSINLLFHKNVAAEKLVKTVATKGGTTEAGIKVMNSNNLNNIFVKVLVSSYKKAKKQSDIK